MFGANHTPIEFDKYISNLYASEDEILKSTIQEMKTAGLPSINVSASEGKLLYSLAKSINAKMILEIGTLGGYSTIWLARALPEDGELVSLEIEQKHAEVARKNIARAGLKAKVEVRVGPALELLRHISEAEQPLYDLVFIDADKDGYLDYFKTVAPLLRPGGMILCDNTLGHSAICKHNDSKMALFNKYVAECDDFTSIIIPVMRDKIDGLTMAVKK